MLESSEDEFLNILKDCWVDRQYVHKGSSTLTFVNVLSDDGDEILFETSWLFSGSRDALMSPKISTMKKSEFKSRLLDSETYSRIK